MLDSIQNHRNEIAEIILAKGQIAIVDLIDSDLSQFKWFSAKSGNYVVRSRYFGDRKAVPERMHRVIMSRMLHRELLPKEQVDHVDGNPLNNRRENLRLASNNQNGKNRKRNSNNTSGFKGVHRVRNKWRAAIKVNYKLIHLGYFDTPKDAHDAYCEAAIKYHGEFARLK